MQMWMWFKYNVTKEFYLIELITWRGSRSLLNTFFLGKPHLSPQGDMKNSKVKYEIIK